MSPPGVTAPSAGRMRLTITGAVQGVGFRPFVYRLASELGLRGWVSNSPGGVLIEIEGAAPAKQEFLLRLDRERPPHSFLQTLEAVHLDETGYAGFEIRPSEEGGEKGALVLPDLATCPECLREILDPGDRRHRYPFTNCTHCGPRYSIIEALPYDRAQTSMRGFEMCPACRAEYENPANRRFHAQPNACPDCGPQLALWDAEGGCLERGNQALHEAARVLNSGRVLAVKGLGGFHLMVRADDEAAVARLRQRKGREQKPLALMVPTETTALALCDADPLELRLLRSAEAPIVLLRRKRPPASNAAVAVAPSVAPGNPCLGIMLPYTPLHHLLLREVGAAVVATSGNLSDEPICIDEREAVRRLRHVADLYLVHDRPIVRHVDDSIVRLVMDREMVLRRARGYAPLPVRVAEPLPEVLAVGGHLKNTIAVGRGTQVFLSQHIGDLDTLAAREAFERVIRDLSRLYEMQPDRVVADLHPDYVSTEYAKKSGKRWVCVQHHCAHVLACMAENDVSAPLLGVAWDGTGFGADGTIWGGEFLRVTPQSVSRVGHLRTFRLPGGDQAVKEPRRSAVGLLHALRGEAFFQDPTLAPLRSFKPAELKSLRTMLRRSVNSPITSSAGRLFDGVASLLALRHESGFEGQAAMDLEFALEPGDSEESYPVRIESVPTNHGADEATLCPVHSDCLAFTVEPVNHVLDWGPIIEAVLADLAAARPVWEISARFHNTLAAAIAAMARKIGEARVVLSGGCFQNRQLLERTVQELRLAGFNPYWHQRVPPNDGGLALGQAVAAARHGRRDPPA